MCEILEQCCKYLFTEQFAGFVGTDCLGLIFRCLLCLLVIAISIHFISKKCKSSSKLSWLVGLSLLFIFIIVVGLFEKITGNKSLKIEVLNIPLFAIEFTGTNSQGILYVLSFFIALLSSSIVSQKYKENRQKQQKMGEKIKSQEYFLNILYKNLENRGENQ